MSYTIAVEEGLEAYFRQPSGPSRPGIDWKICVSGDRAGSVIVRTLFSTDPPNDAEKAALADQAARFVRQKLEQGWTPETGSLLQVDADAAPLAAAPIKPWWRIW